MANNTGKTPDSSNAAAFRKLSLLDPRTIDPDQELVSTADFNAQDLDQIVEVMESMRKWRLTERKLNEASQKYMGLGENDMRAVRFMIASQRHGELATASHVAKHLGITTASVSRMIDRLVANGHVRRLQHPEDRRSTVLEVTEATQTVARQSVGNNHAKRFYAIAELTPHERAAVIKFYAAMIATGS
ncbi:MarR family winged helix-turn-helix transcriptional regulator [Yaniella halotolerans]|uniref:MarR family winged helix-turn-helix transcriptional regulator n=1 Tax=Yaniella halotolerans TaxID=225453 RepID=UPI0003B6C387|nr:MarR family transcriptional regulator [Yaniella halotolerans]